jgi:hypothetical protein
VLPLAEDPKCLLSYPPQISSNPSQMNRENIDFSCLKKRCRLIINAIRDVCWTSYALQTTDEGATLITKTLKLLTLGCAAAVMAGCATSPIPVSENFPLTVQPKVRSAGHWNLVSKDVLAQTLQTLTKVGSSAGLHVSLPPNATTFDKVFREFLITELVKSGRVVQQSPDQAMEVSYQVQIVRHDSPRPQFVPGKFSMVTAGLYALYGLRAEHLDMQLVGGLGLAAVADYVASVDSGGPTHTEMVLTTTVATGGRYLARKTDVYYLQDEDAALFRTYSTQYAAQTMKVVGP